MSDDTDRRPERHDAIIERLARVAWEAVPLLIEPIDGFSDPDDLAVRAALDPGPPTWDQVVALWPDLADDYRKVARAVAAAATDAHGLRRNAAHTTALDRQHDADSDWLSTDRDGTDDHD